MGKKQSKGGSKSTGNWTGDVHRSRLSKKIDKQNMMDAKRAENEMDDPSSTEQPKAKKQKVSGYHRSMLLSHDSLEKREEKKVLLHITKAKRHIEKLRARLEAWDEVQEIANIKALEEEERERKRKEEEANAPGPKKRAFRGFRPETWKLRGAARPAHEVYDFDTRYVCPHMKAREEEIAKAKRSVNAFFICKGKFGQAFNNENRPKGCTELLDKTCREFLAISMQYALLNLETKKFKSARETLLEIIELEGYSTLTPMTNARCRLMRMYLNANRPDSARRLWEKLPSDYTSVWIRYSAALLEFVSWKILEEEGSTQETAEQLLVQAIRGNMYCAYYIGFHETFEQIMEYTEDVEDAEDGTLEQAIEYCNSEQMGSWVGTEGAIEWVQSVIVRVLNSETISGLSFSDLAWEDKLDEMEKSFEEDQANNRDEDNDVDEISVENESDDDNEDAEDIDEKVDLGMFIGMYRTSMEMLQDAGAFSKLK
jgi:septum formation inhibitor MinC